jgi:hypothetical protein
MLPAACALPVYAAFLCGLPVLTACFPTCAPSCATYQCYLTVLPVCATLIKEEIKFSSYIRKFRVEQLQCHI